MPIKILMPALSPTMTEGTLSNWLKSEGDAISPGDVIAEIETDKATMEVEAVDDGVLGKIVVPSGTENVAVNAVIALLLEEGEDASALSGIDLATPGAQAEPSSGNGAAAPATAAPAAEAATAAPAAAPPPSRPASDGRIFASPLARRMAAQHGLDLSQIAGSGPNGRIVKADIETAVATGVGKAAPAPAAAEAPKPAPAQAAAAVAAPAGPSAKDLADMLGMTYSELPNNNMRKTVARRLTEAKQTVPHFYLSIDCRLDDLLALRKQLNERGADHGVKLSVNDMVVKAVALALRRMPAVNAAWTEAAILRFDNVDVSVAVATEGGLITPIIKDTDKKGLGQISAEMKDLAARAREGKLKPEEYQGGTFTVSNLGMYGISHFGAIINPPQACILAVGAGEQRPVVKDGALAIATMMTCTLAVDHRVVDGALGAEYLATFKALIEDPIGMML